MSADELVRHNRRLADGAILHPGGAPAQGPVEAAYCTADENYTYVVREGIVLLLPLLAHVRQDRARAAAEDHGLRSEKLAVQAFYDEVGWTADNDVFADHRVFEDMRPVSAEYLHACHVRLARHLPPAGTYLLDVASGPVQYPEYVRYSAHYQRRVCVDISFAALRAARAKLGPHGIYLLGDITNLPLADGAVDAAVSLHTIYHVPADEQGRAFCELARVLSPGGRAVVVYAWKNRWLRWAQLPARVVQAPWRLARAILGLARGQRQPRATTTGLYFHAHRYRWFVEQSWPFEYRILPWRSATISLLKDYCHDWLLGRQLLRLLLAAEDRFPRAFGRWGAYPLIQIEKREAAPTVRSAAA